MADNIIINEFLTFVQNKIDILDELSILQICASNYTDDEIEEGKNTLYRLCGDGLRSIQRKGEDKKKKNIKDVIKVLKEVDPSNQPVFVARDLNRLPPVTFDYVDVTRLLKDMSAMRTELTQFQTKVSSELTEIHTSLQSQRSTSDDKLSATPKRIYKLSSQRSPQRMIVPSAVQRAQVPANESEAVHTPTYRDIITEKRRPRQEKNKRMINTNTVGSSTTTDGSEVHKLDIQNVNNISNISNDDEKPFTLVQYKKRKPKLVNMRGTLENKSKIQVAESQCFIYISRASKNVTENNIREHIEEMGEECLNIETLKQNRETSFNSFKVKIPCSKLDTFLNAAFWPAGLVYRRYRERQVHTATHSKQI